MSRSISYAAVVGTHNGTPRQPPICARTRPDPDPGASVNESNAEAHVQWLGSGRRSKTSYHGWTSRKLGKKFNDYLVPVNDIRYSRHSPCAERKSNTDCDEQHAYVLTLQITKSLAGPMNALRKEYFPKELNRVPAHLTLFHALPHSQMKVLQDGLSRISSGMTPFAISTGKPFRMRKGVGINVDVGHDKVKRVHGQLRSRWLKFLSMQDAGGFRPHWTIMNKVDDEKKVESAFDTVRHGLSARCETGYVTGLDLWKYQHGRWELADEYWFGLPDKTPELL